MSLVGSLEDLGLGDILQIINLSRKSGVLMLRADGGEGQIVFSEGLIRGAFTDAGPSELHELLLATAAVPKSALEAALEEARARGSALSEILETRSLVEASVIDELRRDHIEAAVLRMFTWPSGEFSFEIREGGDDAGEELFVSPGVNPQFLALEGSRLTDEGSQDEDPDDGGEIEFGFSGEDPVTLEAPIPALPADPEPLCEEMLPLADLVEGDAGDELLEAEPLVDDGPVLAEEPFACEPEPAPAPAVPTPVAGPPPPLVVIDADLAVLEWVKEALSDSFPRIHIFQRSEQGISRIRQYLARPEMPLVLLAEDAPPDPLSGAADAEAIVHRLNAQAARMQIVLLRADDDEGIPSGVVATVRKPNPTELADPRRAGELSELRGRLLPAVESVIHSSAPSGRGAGVSMSPDTVSRLREASARLRDPASRGEVLSLVLQFAAETFSRVALFMIRDDIAIGIAQLGLPKAGGPDDAGLREVELPCSEPAWFRRVIETGGSLRDAPGDEGDQRLAVLLGNAIPGEAYVAPIESGDHIAALLYGDNLPAGKPLGDTAALEVVLHEAGMALDRAVLERALAEAERES